MAGVAVASPAFRPPPAITSARPSRIGRPAKLAGGAKREEDCGLQKINQLKK
jgi:hypothetical protein